MSMMESNEKKEISDLYADMESYFYTVSHELKTPIREIDALAEFVMEDSEEHLEIQSKEDISKIRAICTQTIDLIQNFMEYSKAGYRKLSWETVDLTRMIQVCMEHLGGERDNRHVEIDKFPTIKTDIFLMTQLLENVISNSIKYTKNVETPEILVQYREEKDSFLICCQDNGIGFDMKYASNVFDLFERLHEEDYEGNGVGLATAKKIAERFGGEISIVGKTNDGCITTIKMPKSMIIQSTDKYSAMHKSSELKIGVLGDYSGPYSFMDSSTRYIYEMAADEINQTGGIKGKKIKLLCKDFGGSVTKAIEEAKLLLEVEQIDVLMGGYLSSVREAIRPLVDQHKVIYFYDTLYEGGVADHYTFCTSSVPEQNLYPALAHLYNSKGKKFYIISTDYNYGILSAESAKYYIQKMGGEVVAVEYFQTGKSNFDITIENILEASPDVLVTIMVDKEQGNFHRQWYEKGSDQIAVISTTGVNQAYLHISNQEPILRNTYFMSSFIEEMQLPSAMEFVRKVRSRYSEAEVPYLGCDQETPYIAFYMLKHAIEYAESFEAEDIIRALESGKISIEMPEGTVTMRGEDHHLMRDINLFKVNNENVIELISSFKKVKSDFVESMIKKQYGVDGGLKNLGVKAPNIQYNFMFYKI